MCAFLNVSIGLEGGIKLRSLIKLIMLNFIILSFCYYNIEKGATTLSIMTFRIMTLSVKGLFETFSINDTRNKWRLA